MSVLRTLGAMDTEVLKELADLREHAQQAAARTEAEERRRPLPDGTHIP